MVEAACPPPRGLAFPVHSSTWSEQTGCVRRPTAGDAPPRRRVCKYKSDSFGNAKQEPAITQEQSFKNTYFPAQPQPQAAHLGSGAAALIDL